MAQSTDDLPVAGKRLPPFNNDVRDLKRANSFSRPMGSGVQLLEGTDVAPKEVRKLQSFFDLEHSRKPENPYAIFQVVSGEELKAQLSFNWQLEERVHNASDALRRTDNTAPPSLDGSRVVTSAINPYESEEVANTQDVVPMEIFDPFDPFSSLFFDDGALDFSDHAIPDDPSLMLFPVIGDGPASPPPALMNKKGTMDALDLVRYEPEEEEDGVEPMCISTKAPEDVGPFSSIRDAHATVCYSALEPGDPVSTSFNKGMVAIGYDGSVSLGKLGHDGNINLSDHTIPLQKPDQIDSVCLDTERTTLWIATGKNVTAYDVNDMSRGSIYRLTCEAGESTHVSFGDKSQLLLRGSTLYCGVGPALHMWDVEEVEATTSSDMSSQGGEYESEKYSSLSEGDGSPPYNDSEFFGSSTFSANLHRALQKEYCKVCGRKNVKERIGCTECFAQVCQGCAHMYKLKSFGEVEPRHICETCIAKIRQLILAQQQQGIRQARTRAPSQCFRKPTPASCRQNVCSNGSARSIRVMEPDYTAADSMCLSFHARPSLLTWSVAKSCASRWYLGHTAEVRISLALFFFFSFRSFLIPLCSSRSRMWPLVSHFRR